MGRGQFDAGVNGLNDSTYYGIFCSLVHFVALGSLRLSYTEFLFFSKISLILQISTGYLIPWSCSICSF